MLKTLKHTLATLAFSIAIALPARGQLEHFGFVGGCDTPQTMTETERFTNTCTLDLRDERLADDKFLSRLLLHGIKPIILTHGTFYEQHDDPAYPHGAWDLKPGYKEAWTHDIQGKESAITNALFLYLADEPSWNGISREELRIAHDTVKRDFPHTQTLTSLNHKITPSWFEGQEIPVDAIGYHQYDLLDPRQDSLFQENLAMIKAHAHEKPFVYVLDAFWEAVHHQGEGGLSPSDMGEVARNYYEMALNDPDAVALVGLAWQGFEGYLGARDLPENVQRQYRQIGREITEKCIPPVSIRPEHALMLQGCRFAVTTEYATTRNAGHGTATQLTDDSGYFWFFRDSNVETTVKVLDGCAKNGRFWVFISGMTNLRVKTTVQDTKTGTRTVYESPLGTAFTTVQDTYAFGACD